MFTGAFLSASAWAGIIFHSISHTTKQQLFLFYWDFCSYCEKVPCRGHTGGSGPITLKSCIRNVGSI